jgi:hypothetical protein
MSAAIIAPHLTQGVRQARDPFEPRALNPTREMTPPHRQADAHHEELLEVAELAPGILLRGAEVGMAVLVGLLAVPPLGILAVVVVVPLLAIAIVVGLIAAIVAMPYLLIRHVGQHHRTHRSSVVAHCLRRLRERVA